MYLTVTILLEIIKFGVIVNFKKITEDVTTDILENKYKVREEKKLITLIEVMIIPY